MRRFLVVVVAILAAEPAHAISCTFKSVPALAFGTYDPQALLPLTTSGNLVFRCTGVLPVDLVTVDLSAGGGTLLARRMTAPSTRTLDYNVYVDPTLLLVWGNGGGGTAHYGPILPVGTDVTLVLYGAIPARQAAWAGAYSDSLTATINY